MFQGVSYLPFDEPGTELGREHVSFMYCICMRLYMNSMSGARTTRDSPNPFGLKKGPHDAT